MQTSEGANEETFNRLTRTIPPMDTGVAEKLLLEAKQVLDELGITFFLRQGTCLGAVRDGALIPWDDDLDLGIVVGLHGFAMGSIHQVIAAFQERGFYVKAEQSAYYYYVALVKQNQKIDLNFFQMIDGMIYHYPGVWIPVRLFRDLKEIEFIGQKFLAPNPPEEYLRYKYGPDWITPKQVGYEQDVVDRVYAGTVPGHMSVWRQLFGRRLFPWRAARLRVLDHEGQPVHLAEVTLVGHDRFKTDRDGYVKLYPPRDDYYALTVHYRDHKEVLYEERMAPAGSYVYRPDPTVSAGRIFILSER